MELKNWLYGSVVSLKVFLTLFHGHKLEERENRCRKKAEEPRKIHVTEENIKCTFKNFYTKHFVRVYVCMFVEQQFLMSYRCVLKVFTQQTMFKFI